MSVIKEMKIFIYGSTNFYLKVFFFASTLRSDVEFFSTKIVTIKKLCESNKKLSVQYGAGIYFNWQSNCKLLGFKKKIYIYIPISSFPKPLSRFCVSY